MCVIGTLTGGHFFLLRGSAMTLMGFKDKSAVKPLYNFRAPWFIYPNEVSTHSCNPKLHSAHAWYCSHRRMCLAALLHSVLCCTR